MENKAFTTIKDLKKLIEAQQISLKEVVSDAISRAEKHKDLNALIEVFDEQSILDASSKQGILAGIPGYIKDNIVQKGRNASCASAILKDFNSPYDATATARLKNAGALIMGRANMDEFAMGSSGETSYYGVTKNPWAKECVAGGSSSGSIAAVAAGLGYWALGSETGGSVRLPAALCGIVGLKPTYGAVSRFGLIAYGSSLDQIGVAARTVYDTALVFGAIAGNDPYDSTTLSRGACDFTQSLDGSIKKGLKIGVPEEAINGKGLNLEIKQAVQAALKKYEEMGAVIVPLSMKSLAYGAACYFILSRAEAASNLARFDGIRYGTRAVDATNLIDLYEKTRAQGFGQEVKARILVGNYVLSVGHADQFYNSAQKVRMAIAQEFAQVFEKVDVIAMPTHSVPAFKVGEYDNDKLAMDLQDYFTAPMNLAGIPALSIPVGFTADQKPIGMQFAGPHSSEELLFQVAHAYEQVTDWHKIKPENF